MRETFDFVFIGLSITSSWGNGHATTYRGLIKELSARGKKVLFLEQDAPWYAENRDLPAPPYCEMRLYQDKEQLFTEYAEHVREAGACIVGSYVPDGMEVGSWAIDTCRNVTAFYDIDTPVTLSALRAGKLEYIDPELIARYDLYLSFTGGPTLDLLQDQYGSPRARALYCSFDPEVYYPERAELRWDLGYMGTYSDDRQPTVERMLIEPARRDPRLKVVVAGPQYPSSISWPANVERIEHLPPAQHRTFYNSQRFTVNITRSDMIEAGYSPSVRLFEAAACGVPIISDRWAGIETLFEPGSEILFADDPGDMSRILGQTSENKRRAIGAAARDRVTAEHTAEHRAQQLESYINEAVQAKAERPKERERIFIARPSY
jgi:spore maturation protein CgeB